MKITKELLKEWSACSDGYSWFVRTFPQGGDVHEVGVALRAEKRYDDSSKAASSGYSSKAASSGYYSLAASSGDYSTAASSGDSSTAASSGYYSTAASSGNYSKAASSGDYSTAEASGEKTIAMVAGCNGKARAGLNGAFALAWLDGEQMRIAVGIVGEAGIKADTWYRVDAGQLVEVAS